MRRQRSLSVALAVLCGFSCGSAPTSPERAVPAAEIDRLLVFVRNWPDEYVEIDFTRSARGNTLVMYRPAQPGVPRILLDSIGPQPDDPKEIVELLQTFDVWAMADSNAVGAACNTKRGGWICNPTFNDYSLVMAVTRRGVSRSQRYTRLGESSSNRRARALGDFVVAWSRARAADSCSGTRPDFGGVATAADRALFAYDAGAPSHLQQTIESTSNGVETSSISFSSPDGGLVTGLMWDPVTRSSPRPGMVVMHGLPGRARDLAALGQNYAERGAVVIAIDAPFARRSGPALRFTVEDRAEQIQVVKDLQRAVDVLRARPNVDAARIAFLGFSWGGATGALFVGIEPRLKAAALVVGHGGQVSHATGADGFKYIAGLSCATRVAWIRAMAPVEPIRFVGNANIPLLLQNGTLDEFIPRADAEELHRAAPQSKEVRWYDAGHNLTPQAGDDRLRWLQEKIGLDSPPRS